MMRLIFLPATLFAASLAPVSAAEEIADSLERNYASELTRIPPTDPEDILDTFQIHPDFRIELVAAEPLVRDPVAMAFDERGRMYVVEIRGFSEGLEEHIGAVRLLVDTDSDGVFDSSPLFAGGSTSLDLHLSLPIFSERIGIDEFLFHPAYSSTTAIASISIRKFG